MEEPRLVGSDGEGRNTTWRPGCTVRQGSFIYIAPFSHQAIQTCFAKAWKQIISKTSPGGELLPSAAGHGRTQTGKNLVIVNVMAKCCCAVCVSVHVPLDLLCLFLCYLKRRRLFCIERNEKGEGGS